MRIQMTMNTNKFNFADAVRMLKAKEMELESKLPKPIQYPRLYS